MKNNALLDTIQIVHFCNDMFVCSYPYIINPIYDIYFAIFMLLTVLSWPLLKNECIISYFEKKIENPNYVLGSQQFYNPYHKKFYYYNGTNYAFIKEFFWVVTFLILIFYRKNKKYVKFTLISALLLAILIKAPQFINKNKSQINDKDHLD
jgi:hypothetical protein